MDDERLISLTEAAARSGLSAGHLRHLAEKGILPARKVGRNWITTTRAVAEYLKNEELLSRQLAAHSFLRAPSGSGKEIAVVYRGGGEGG